MNIIRCEVSRTEPSGKSALSSFSYSPICAKATGICHPTIRSRSKQTIPSPSHAKKKAVYYNDKNNISSVIKLDLCPRAIIIQVPHWKAMRPDAADNKCFFLQSNKSIGTAIYSEREQGSVMCIVCSADSRWPKN